MFRSTNALCFLISLVWLGACGAPAPQSQLNADLPAPQDELPLVGMGYSTMDARVTGTSCFDKLPIEVLPAQESQLEFYHNLGSEQLSKLMEAGIEVGVPVYPGITVQGRASYAEEFAAGKFAETITLHFKAVGARSRVYFGDDSLGSMDAIKPIDRLAKLIDDKQKAAIRQMCGDRYVSEIEKGAEFTATLKMEFNNEFQRNAYGAGFGAEILGGIAEVNVDVAFEKLMAKSNVNVSLAVEQKGGNPLALLGALPNKGWDAEVDASDKGIPMSPRQREILDQLKTGVSFLNCNFETRVACIAIFQRLSQVAQDLSKDIKNDSVDADGSFLSGNMIPIGMTTLPYPVEKELAKAALGEEEAQVLQQRFQTVNDLRGRLMQISAQTKEARRRAESIQLNGENLDVLLGGDSAQTLGSEAYKAIKAKYEARFNRLAAVVDRSNAILLEVGKVEQACWDSRNIMKSDGSGVRACADGVQNKEQDPDLKDEDAKLVDHPGVNGLEKKISEGELFIDARDLIGDPESLTEWCYYANAPLLQDPNAKEPQSLPAVLEGDEIKTVEALVKTAGTTLTGTNLLSQCYDVEKAITRMITAEGALNLSGRGIYSVKPLNGFAEVKSLDLSGNSITDPAPLSRLKKLTTLVLDQNKLKSAAGVELIQPAENSDSYLSLSGNQISSGFDRILNGKTFKWKRVRFGKNPTTKLDMAVQPAHVTSLDITGSLIRNIDGFKDLKNASFELIMCANKNLTCPFTQTDQRRCTLDIGPRCL